MNERDELAKRILAAARDPNSWPRILADIKAGQYPERERIAAAIRSGEPPPTEAAEYIAALVEGEIKPARGRPRKSIVDKFIADWWREQRQAVIYDEIAQVRAEQGRTRDTVELGLERAAKRLNLSLETVRNAYRRR